MWHIAIARAGNTGGHFVYLLSVLTNKNGGLCPQDYPEAFHLNVRVTFKEILFRHFMLVEKGFPFSLHLVRLRKLNYSAVGDGMRCLAVKPYSYYYQY